MMLDIWAMSRVGIDKVDACGIRDVSVCNKCYLLIGLSIVDGLTPKDNRRAGFSVVSNMVSIDFKAFTGDKEEEIMMRALGFDICFIIGAYIVYRTFISQI